MCIWLEGKRKTRPGGVSLKGQMLRGGQVARQEVAQVREAEVSLTLSCGCRSDLALLNLTSVLHAGAVNLHHANHSIS